MMEKITLDMLTQNGVSVKKQQYILNNGKEHLGGQPWRRAYVNSINGREQVDNEVPEPYKAAIFMIWGEKPTISEDEY